MPPKLPPHMAVVYSTSVNVVCLLYNAAGMVLYFQQICNYFNQLALVMAPMLVVLLESAAVWSTIAQRQVYVTPDNNSHSCPSGSTCHNLHLSA